MLDNNIQFEEEQEWSRERQQSKQTSFSLTALVQKFGLASDERTANFVLGGIIVIAIFATIAIVVFSGRNNTVTPAQQAQINKIEQLQRAIEATTQP